MITVLLAVLRYISTCAECPNPVPDGQVMCSTCAMK